MRIWSPANEYTIITQFNDGRRFAALDREGRLCLVVIEKRPLETKRLVPILMAWQQIRDFSDFYEFFPYDGGIAAVFAHHTGGESLADAVKDMAYPQRAAVLRALFALVIRHCLPPEILDGVLCPNNLRLYPSGSMTLLYDFPYAEDSAFKDTVACICGDAVAEMTPLYEKMAHCDISHYAELYEAAGLAADALARYVPPPAPKKRSLRDIKEQAAAVKTAISGRVAAWLAIAVLLAGYVAVGILFYRTVTAPPAVDNGIDAIGTVVIDDGR